MEASNSQGQTEKRSVQQRRRPTRIERYHSILFLRRYVPHVSELPEDAQNEPLGVMQNIFVAVLLEGLGIVVQNRNEALERLSVAVVLDGESLDVLGIRIRVIDGRGNVIYYFPLEEVATWSPRTRTLFLGNVFNQTHFAHLEHHQDNEHDEDLTNVGDDNPQEYSQEVEQNVQLQQVEEPHQEVHQEVQFEFYPVAQQIEHQEEEPHQEVHQEVQFEFYPVVQQIEHQEEERQQNVQQQYQVEQQFGQAQQQDVQLELYEVEQQIEQGQDVQPQHQVEQQFQQRVPQDVQLQHEVEQQFDNNNGGFMVDSDGDLVMLGVDGHGVLVDEDGDVVMVGVGEGVADEGVYVQPPQVEHGYPLGNIRGQMEFRGGRQQRRGRVGRGHRRGRRGRGRFH